MVPSFKKLLYVSMANLTGCFGKVVSTLGVLTLANLGKACVVLEYTSFRFIEVFVESELAFF